MSLSVYYKRGGVVVACRILFEKGAPTGSGARTVEIDDATELLIREKPLMFPFIKAQRRARALKWQNIYYMCVYDVQLNMGSPMQNSEHAIISGRIAKANARLSSALPCF